MQSVLIADDNKSWLEILESRINQEPEFEVVATALDGKEAIEMIEKKRPEVIILDIIMPEFDGAHIVNHVRTQMNDYNPVIYILSGIGTDTIIKVLNDLEIDFYSMKPVSIEIVIHYLKTIIAKKRHENFVIMMPDEPVLQSTVTNVRDFVYRLGMPRHLLSTDCIIDTLIYYIDNPNCLRLLTKILYPKIAKARGVSASSVEKNIRNAILQMQKNNSELYQRVFSYSGNNSITNGEFLSTVVDFMAKERLIR